jgi:hypothetical protein
MLAFRCRNLIRFGSLLLMLLATGFTLSSKTLAQTPTPQQSPELETPMSPVNVGVGRNRLECAGYFRMPPLTGVPEIVGGEEEQEQNTYAAGDILYINQGSLQGVKEGQEFHVIRPRGFVEKVYRQKKGTLGTFVQELGQIRVIRVKPNVSVAQVIFSCETILLGDLLTGGPDRISPDPFVAEPLDRFSDSSGLPTGRVMMSRDGRELLAAGDVIYIDIGAEDNAVLGDFVTIYRKVNEGRLFEVKRAELARRSEKNYASDKFRGGTFSIQAQRSKDTRDEAGLYIKSPIKTTEVKSKRPVMPRKVVGEALIVNVQQRTATAVIVRSAQEVHTGDYVQIKWSAK